MPGLRTASRAAKCTLFITAASAGLHTSARRRKQCQLRRLISSGQSQIPPRCQASCILAGSRLHMLTCLESPAVTSAPCSFPGVQGKRLLLLQWRLCPQCI